MGLFRSRRPEADRVPMTRLSEGHARFDRGKGAHFGSPETVRDCGRLAYGRLDYAAAAAYYGKAIDISQTWSSSPTCVVSGTPAMTSRCSPSTSTRWESSGASMSPRTCCTITTGGPAHHPGRS